MYSFATLQLVSEPGIRPDLTDLSMAELFGLSLLKRLGFHSKNVSKEYVHGLTIITLPVITAENSGKAVDGDKHEGEVHQ